MNVEFVMHVQDSLKTTKELEDTWQPLDWTDENPQPL